MEQKLNNDLLKAEEPEEKTQPKRGSKQELIEKILEVAQKNDIEIELSDTKLKRLSKAQLNELLAETVEKAMRNEMARQVGAKPGAADSVIALGALRMIHDIAAKGTEKALNNFLPQYGYEVNGFSDALREPSVREATDACLAEIAADSEILQYIESPWARLSIAWGGALVASIEKKRVRTRYYATDLGQYPHPETNPRCKHRPRRRAENGEIHCDEPPSS